MTKGKLYVLSGNWNECGFFCVFSYLCAFLYDDSPNVNISWANNRYSTPGTDNVLDYVFSQKYADDFDVISVNNSGSPFIKRHSNGAPIFYTPNPSQNKEIVTEFNERFWRVLSLRPEIINDIQPLLDVINNNKTLAVHIRRSDIFRLDYFKPYVLNDPNNLENYYYVIQNVFNEGNYKKIFLCTEDENVFEYLKLKFEDKLIYNPGILRVKNSSIDTTSVGVDLYNNNVEEFGKKTIQGIFKDVIVASKCSGFLGSSFSGVSVYIELLNNNNFEKLEFINLIRDVWKK